MECNTTGNEITWHAGEKKSIGVMEAVLRGGVMPPFSAVSTLFALTTDPTRCDTLSTDSIFLHSRVAHSCQIRQQSVINPTTGAAKASMANGAAATHARHVLGSDPRGQPS